ncbi:uncharacterized protein LOC112557108 [Pomacea canaliculata]|uniref:uncharacterized protein LOC112557108 n=1 Tax=Pomacea canaliculata TaxID=400727 RepID=UPI000D73BD1D|nr:uncharacterized protein LOC112557108 [Pomacea canaliculata]
MLPRACLVCVIAVVCVTIATAQSSDPVEIPPEDDIKSQSKALISQVRELVTKAKEGISLDSLRQDVLDLKTFTSSLLQQVPSEISECDIQTIIKMAAAATRSHEVLQVLLAKDAVSLLGARLGLCLATMSEIAQQFEGELTLSSDEGPYLTAIIFTIDLTSNVIDTADKDVTAIALPPDSSLLQVNRARRQGFDLGGGWSAGLNGISWQSPSGGTEFNVKPTFNNGIIPDGFKAGLRFNF